MKGYFRYITAAAMLVAAASLFGCGSGGGNGNSVFSSSSAADKKTAKVTVSAAFPANSGAAIKSVMPEGTATIDVYYRTVAQKARQSAQGDYYFSNYTTVESNVSAKLTLTAANPTQSITLQPAESAAFVAVAFDKDGVLLGSTYANGQLLPGDNDVRLIFLDGDWRLETPVTLSDNTVFNGMEMRTNYNGLTGYLQSYNNGSAVDTATAKANLQNAIESFLRYRVGGTTFSNLSLNPIVNGKALSTANYDQYYGYLAYDSYYGNAYNQSAFSGAKSANVLDLSLNVNSNCSANNNYNYYNDYDGSSFRGAYAIRYKFSSYSTCAAPKAGDKRISMNGNGNAVYNLFKDVWNAPVFSNYSSSANSVPTNYVLNGSMFENYLFTSGLTKDRRLANFDKSQVTPLETAAVLNGTTITGNLFEMVVTVPYSYEIVKASAAKAAKLSDLAAMKSSAAQKAKKASQSATNMALTNLVYTDYAPVVIVTRKSDGTIDYGDWQIDGSSQTATWDQATNSYKYTYKRPAPLKDPKTGTEFYPEDVAYISPKQTYDSTTGKYVYTLPNKGGLDSGIALPSGKTNIGDWCDGNSSQVSTYDNATRTYTIDRTRCGKPEYGADGVVDSYEFITVASYDSSTYNYAVAKTVAATTTETPKINYGDFVVTAYLKTSETYNAYSYPVTLKGKPLPRPTFGRVVALGPVRDAMVAFAGSTATSITDSSGRYYIAAPGAAVTSTGGWYANPVYGYANAAPGMSAEAGATVVTPITTVLNQLTGTVKADFLAALTKLTVTAPLTAALLSVDSSADKTVAALYGILADVMSAGTKPTAANLATFAAALSTSINAATPATPAALAATATDAAASTGISTANFASIAANVETIGTIGATGGASVKKILFR